MSAIGEKSPLDCQVDYWNTVGSGKTFTHPLHTEWLHDVDRESRVLDIGCGYGRTLAMLHENGWVNLAGVDIAPALVRRARLEVPDADVEVLNDPPHLPHADRSFDVVLLLAVLTCIPTDQGQRALVHEIGRVLRPTGVLCVSDVLLQTDARNTARYERFVHEHDTEYGVFRTDDGAVCRHHERRWLHDLFSAFDTVCESDSETPTMNGNAVMTTQLLLRKATG